MSIIKPTKKQDQTVIIYNDSNITVNDLSDSQIGIDQNNGNISVVKIVNNTRTLGSRSMSTK